MEEHPKRMWWVLRAALWALTIGVVLFVGVILFAPCGSRAAAVRATEASTMRCMVLGLSGGREESESRPRCVAQLVYECGFNPGALGYRSDLDYTAFAFGKYSLDDLAGQRMSQGELDAEVLRVLPAQPAWDRLGPITMCFDPRVFEQRPSGWLIVGTMKNYATSKRGAHEFWVAFADGAIAGAGGLDAHRADALERSLAYYESIGIPMPEEMVRELREAMWGK